MYKYALWDKEKYAGNKCKEHKISGEIELNEYFLIKKYNIGFHMEEAWSHHFILTSKQLNRMKNK